MWSYKLINFPFGKEETTEWEIESKIKICKTETKKIVQKSFIKDSLWELFDQVKDL
jgi:hypothetical protein